MILSNCHQPVLTVSCHQPVIADLFSDHIITLITLLQDIVLKI